jgi:NAD(P)-dependent dehydrogenase (short-subunit alcohol dehydrogenase family)
MRVVVIGASSGLGRCIGIDRGKRGDQVALLARRKENLFDAAAEAGPTAHPITCDVADEDGCRAAIDEAATALGGIDALVYATGVGPLGPIDQLPASEWRRAFDTNVVGAAIATSAALPYLVEAKGVAAFLSTVSASLTPPWPGLAGYTVTKAALDKLVEAWRAEHPHIGFTRIVVGDCAGGEGDAMTQFANDWDTEYAAEVLPTWLNRGYMNGGLVEVAELLRVVDTVIYNRAVIPSVTVTPRAPA